MRIHENPRGPTKTQVTQGTQETQEAQDDLGGGEEDPGGSLGMALQSAFVD